MNRSRITVFGAIAVAALVLASCRAEEQGRITNIEPGVYKGKKDTMLSAAQEEQLRERARAQGDSTYISVGGGSKAVSKSAVNTDTLKGRIDGQRVR